MAEQELQLPTREELSELSHDQLCVYAARCALRVFPLLQFFGHEPNEHQRRYYRAIEAAALAALLRHPAAAAAAADFVYASHAARAAAAAAGVAASTAAASDEAAYGAFEAFEAAGPDGSELRQAFIRGAQADFENFRNGRESLESVVQSRLWSASESNPAPDFVVEMYKDFALRLYGVDLGDAAHRYKMLFLPSSVDISALRQAVDNWYEEYQAENAQKNAEAEPNNAPGPNSVEEQESTEELVKEPQRSAPALATPTTDVANEANEDGVKEPSAAEPAADTESEASASSSAQQPTPPPPIGLSTQFVDRPAHKDLLGREPLVYCLSHLFASDKQDTPLTLALLGDWGAGKSSVMQMIEDRLKEDWPDRCRFAWFNAWEYEKTENMGAGLAQEVVNGLFDELSWLNRWRVQVRFVIKRLRKSVVQNLLMLSISFVAVLVVSWAILNMLDTFSFGKTVAVGGAGALILLLIKGLSMLATTMQHPFATTMKTFLKAPQYGEHLGMIPVLREQLCDMVPIVLQLPRYRFDRQLPPGPQSRESERDWRDWLLDCCNAASEWFVRYIPRVTGRNERLIVWVDDLDRCDQNGITATLEAVRLIMDIPNVIVCIAVDHRIALRAIAQQYDKLASDKRPKEAIARDYLGKIIQLPIRLGRAPNVDGFIDGRLFTEVIDKDVDWEMLGFGVDDPPIISDTSESSQEYNQVDDNSVEPRGGGGDGGPPSGTDGTDVTDSPDLRIAHDDRDVGRIEGSETDFDESEAERLDEVMQHTDEEHLLFKELTRHYEFTNPRQLSRLHNSYRLLKLLDHRLRNGSEIPTKEDDREKFSFMHILFWEEFLHRRGVSMQSADANTPWSKSLPPNLTKFGLPLRRHFQKRRPGQDALAVEQFFKETRKFAERMVLPLGDAPVLRKNDSTAVGESA